MLLAFTGRMGSGKDTCAEHLIQKYGFVRFAFADQLKALAKEIGWNGEKDEAGRRLLQQLGNGARVHLGSEIWIRAMENVISNSGRKHNLVVTDVRYPNEEEWVRQKDGFLIRIERPSVNRNGLEHQHVTEKNIDAIEADLTLVNDGTIEELYHKLDAAVVYFATNRAPFGAFA